MAGNVNLPAEWYKSLKDGPQSRDAIGLHDADELVDETPQISSHNDITSETEHEDRQHAASNTTVTDNSLEVQKWRDKLKELFDDLDRRLVTKPDVFLPGVKAWVGSYDKLFKSKPENGVASLFAMRGWLRTGKHIKPQPTAPARRVGTHLGGRDCRKTGTPNKAARTSEHGYTASRKSNGHMAPAPPVKKRHDAPHSLSYRVDSVLRNK